ncbi:MAG TPA: CotH kinase family protein [Gemmataceae bacterium]|jgi:spore coat protein CotH
MGRSLLWLTVLLSLAAASSTSKPALDKKASPGDRVFGAAKVVQFHLTMSEKQFAALAPAEGPRFGPGFGPPRKQPEGTHRNQFGVDLPWSKGDVTFDGRTYKDVGVRYKGNYTFMATARSLKRSMKFDLNRYVEAQKLDGLTMLTLNCGVSDPSRAREALAYAFFRDAGVPAPRTSFAEVTLTVPGKYDKELVGVYTAVEQVNKGFLKRHFKDGSGMLLKPEGLHGGPAYLGPDWKAYEGRYRPKADPTDEQKKRLIEFTKLISSGSDEAFAKEIGSYLDVEAFLRFIAANALLSNLDSYLGYGHNYFLYLVPKTNQFVFIPWDLDLSLATWPAAGTPEQQVRLSLDHPHTGQNKLLDRLFAIKEHKEKYLAIVKELTSTSFTKKKLLEHLEPIEKALKEPIAKEAEAVAARKEGRGRGGFGMGFGGQFGHSMPPRKFIEKRTELVADLLAGKTKGFEPKPFGFGFGRPPAAGGGPEKKDR